MARFDKQLIQNLDEYQNAGIIDADTRERFNAYLSSKIDSEKSSVGKFMMNLIYVLGTAILALGVILIIAYNWTDFPKFMRLFIGFAPLLASGALACWYLKTKAVRADFWREIIAVLNITGVITSIAVVSQVYQINGNFADFIRTVFFLTALLPFIFNSSFAAVVNIVFMFLILANSRHSEPFIESIYLTVLGLFLAYKALKEKTRSKIFTLAVFAIFAPLLLNIQLTAYYTDFCDLYIVLYPVFAGLFLALLSLLENDSAKKYFLPVTAVAGITAFITLLVFTFKGFLEFSEKHTFNDMLDKYNAFHWIVFAVIMLWSIAYVVFFVKSMLSKSSNKTILALSAVGFIGIFAFLLSEVFQVSEGKMYAFYIGVNIFAIAISLAYIFRGIRRFSLGYTNVGALMFAVFIFTKFLSDEFTMFTRGIVFIVLGIGIILLNKFVLSKKNERNA